jgi:hypothetical protein
LQLDTLLKQTSVKGIRETLETLPTSLNDFYDQILVAIDNEHQYIASVALQWLAFASRPLTLRELAEAVIIRAGEDPVFDPDERFMDENVLLNILPSGLVRTDLRRPALTWHPEWRHDQNYAYVEFAHFSVLEYLKSNRMSHHLRPRYQIIDSVAKLMTAKTCFAYLICIGLTKQGCELMKYRTEPFEWKSSIYALCQELDEEYLFLNYACRAWPYHAAQLEGAKEITLEKLAMQFLDEHSNSWVIWCFFTFNKSLYLQYHWEYEPICRNYLSGPYATDLHYPEEIHPMIAMSWLGLQDLLLSLLRREPTISKIKQHFWLGGPLHAAALAGSWGSARILLGAGADINEEGGGYGTPLSAACRSKSISVVKLLIKVGADLNARNGLTGDVALTVACGINFIDGVKVLLEYGADVDAVTALGSPLIQVITTGNAEIVKLLLEWGADPNLAPANDSMDISKIVLLFHAVLLDEPEIVMFLLEAGAEIGLKEDREGVYQKAMDRENCAANYLRFRRRQILAILDAHFEAKEVSKMEGSPPAATTKSSVAELRNGETQQSGL